jgi:capsid protein
MELTTSPIASLALAMRAKALFRSSPDGGSRWLSEIRAPAEAHRQLELSGKTAVGTGSSIFDFGTYGGGGIGTWPATLQRQSAMMRMIEDASFVRGRLNEQVAVTTRAAIGYVVGEGRALPLSPVEMRNVTLVPARCAALVVVSDTQLRDLSSGGQAALNRTIRDAVARVIDSAFIDMIVSTGTPSFPASGSTASACWSDLRQALLEVSASGTGQIYAIASPAVGAMLATLATTDGAQVFSAAPSEVANFPLLISEGAPAGEIIFVNASQVAADATPIVPVGTTQSSIEMSDAPTHNSTTPTPTTLVSLWQTNAVGLGCQAWIAAQPLNDSAVAVITGVDYGAGP